MLGDQGERLTAVLAARNPFLAAANPLLQAVADMPQQLEPAGIEMLRQMLEIEVKAFTRVCDQGNLRREHMLAVRYALCTALDETANLTPWGGGTAVTTGPWSGHALLQTFHQEGDGGKKVFLLIGRLASNPQEHLPVLEVMLHLLGLGFQGHYRLQIEGRRMIETIRNRLYNLVVSAYEAVPRELSQQWEEVPPGKRRLLHNIPVWASAGVLGLFLLVALVWNKHHLTAQSEVIEARIRDIGKLMPAPQRLRLKELLASEIEAGRVDVDETALGLHSKVTFPGDDMYSVGLSEINVSMAALLEKVAAGINEVSGTVKVVGHTDNTPIATREFPNNLALSEKRAHAVAQLLEQNHVEPSRITTIGMGEAQPAADNVTPEGRTRNRRVEIIVDSQ